MDSILDLDIPDQDLMLNSWTDDAFDLYMGDYMGELANSATDVPYDAGTVGPSFEQQAPVDANAPNAADTLPVLQADSDWFPDDLQAPDTAPTLAGPASRVVTTGALPIVSSGPANFQTGLSSAQQGQQWPGYSQAQQPLVSQFAAAAAAATQQPGTQMDSFQSQAQGFRKPSPGLSNLQPQASDEILGKVENALAGSDIPPEVRAQLMNFMASNQRAKRSQAAALQPAWQQQPHHATANSLAPAGNMFSGSMLPGSMGSGAMPGSLGLSQQQLPGSNGAAWDQMMQFNSSQPSAMLGQGQATGRHSKPQSSLPAVHAFPDLPELSTHMGQSFQGMPGASKPAQHRPTLQSVLPQTNPLQRGNHHLAMQRAQEMLQRTPAQSLQNQAHRISHRPAPAAPQVGGPPSSIPAQQGLHASTAGLAGMPAAANVSAPGSLLDAWDLPDLAALHGDHQPGVNNLHLDPIGSLGSYNGQPADQPPHQSAPAMPLPYDPVSLPGASSTQLPQNALPLNPLPHTSLTQNPLTQTTLPRCAPLPAQASALPQGPVFPAQRPAAAAPVPVPLQNQGAQQLPRRPAQQAPPVRAPAPPAPNADLLPQAGINIPPALQATSQQSSDASCGFGGPAFSSAFLPLTSSPPGQQAPGLHTPGQQAPGLHPPAQQPSGHQAPPPPTQPLSAGVQQPGGAADEPLDWALDNLDQLDTQGDNNPQEDAQPGQGQGPGQDAGKQGPAGKPGEKQKRKRKRDAHQQQLNKEAQHRYRERKKAKAAELQQQVQEMSAKAANLQAAKATQVKLKERNEQLRKAVEAKEAEVAHAQMARQSPAGSRQDDTLAAKVAAIEQKAAALAQQLHNKVFELNRHLKQSGLANKENVPWDGGIADPATAPSLEVIRRLVHEIHVITHEAHKVEGADVWEVIHRKVPLRPCPPTCSCLHCKDKDAWLDVAESLKLTHEQKCKTMLSRDHTLQTLRAVYDARRKLNLEAIKLMVPQPHDALSGRDAARKQQFAELAFFSRARSTGQMGEVVDKLKANLREEAHANAVLDYIMFSRILSPVQSAWFITEAYPLKFDCQALATAVYQIWGNMQMAPYQVPQHQTQPQARPRQQLNGRASARALASLQQPQQLQGNHTSLLPNGYQGRRLEAQPGSLQHQLQMSQQQQKLPGLASTGNVTALPGSAQMGSQCPQSQPGLAQSAWLPQQQQQQQLRHLAQSGLPQSALQQQLQQQQQLHQLQQPQQPQSQQQQVRGLQPQLAAAQAGMRNPLLQQAQAASMQRALPASAGLLQGQGIDKRQWQQLLQQQHMGMPARQQGGVPSQLTALQQAGVGQPSAGLLDQRLMGLGGMPISGAMLAGGVPRPAGARLPMAGALAQG